MVCRMRKKGKVSMEGKVRRKRCWSKTDGRWNFWIFIGFLEGFFEDNHQLVSITNLDQQEGKVVFEKSGTWKWVVKTSNKKLKAWKLFDFKYWRLIQCSETHLYNFQITSSVLIKSQSKMSSNIPLNTILLYYLSPHDAYKLKYAITVIKLSSVKST